MKHIRAHILSVLALIFVCTVIGSTVLGCTREAPSPEPVILPEPEPVRFTIASAEGVTTLDPHFAESKLEVLISEALFEGLLDHDAVNGRPIPGLAESWNIDDSGTIITLQLREAFWSDGIKITAEAAAASIFRALSHETLSPLAWYPVRQVLGAMDYNAGITGVESLGVRAVDENTLEIELVKPLPYYEDLLLHPVFTIVPVHLIPYYPDTWTDPEHIVVNGAYTLEQTDEAHGPVLQKNDVYWDAENVTIDTVEIMVEESEPAVFSRYDSGDADWALQVPADESWEEAVDLFRHPKPVSFHLILQTERPPFHNVKLRKALSMAVDRSSYSGPEVPAASLVPPMCGYPVIDGNGYDPEMARELLARAGFKDGSGFPPFTILINGTEANRVFAEFVRDQWAETLNITCGIQEEEIRSFSALRRAGSFQIVLTGWEGQLQDPSEFLLNYIGGSPYNSGRYDSDEYDSLLDDAASAMVFADRMAKLRQAEEVLITRDQAVIPLFFASTTQRFNKMEWGGWHGNILDLHPLKALYPK